MCAIAVACAACGGSNGGGSPAPTPAPTPPPSGFAFDYDPTITAADRQVIEHAMALGKPYFLSTFGETVRNTVTVHVRDADNAGTATAHPNELTLYTQTIDWQRASQLTKTKILVHELFHVLQYDVTWIPRLGDPNWLVEGSAEYVGYAASVSDGLVAFDRVKACQVNKFFAFGGPTVVPRLENVTSSDPGSYPEAWLAVDRLIGGPGGLPKLASFWKTGPPTASAFATAFGVGLSTFYADFEPYRQSLTTQSADCNGI